MIWNKIINPKRSILIMAFDNEKLAQMAKPRSEAAIERAKARIENREWLRMSQDIALSLHHYLRTKGMTQKELADNMGVSAVYVGKLLKGGENLTLETICKIQKVIGVGLVSVARPYVSRILITFTPITKFSASAVRSEKYSCCQMTQDSYIMAAGDAA